MDAKPHHSCDRNTREKSRGGIAHALDFVAYSGEHMKRFLVLILIPAALAAQKPAKTAEMSARQLFYDEGKPAPPKPTVTPKPPPAKAPSKPSKATPLPEANTIPVALVSHTPLALRYSIVKLENGEELEVPGSRVFRSGDQVRLKVQVNQRGYLYLISRGSSGIWKPLFPSREATDNVIDARQIYAVPSSTLAFTFDEQAGKERIFLLFSRTPVEDLDALIDNLRGRAPAPSAAPRRPEMTLAQNLNDQRVDGLRKMYSRDLIIEAVETKKAPASARPVENAVYVANASTSMDSRVVADIELTHAAK